MRSSLQVLMVSTSISLLSACGGGGGSSPSPNLPPAPTPPPPANTSLPYFLPLSPGNTWTFSSGGKIVDTGTGTLACNCAYSGGKIESHDLLTPSGTYGGTFYYAKKSGLQGSGSLITYLVGISTDHGQTIQLAGSATTNSGGVIPGLGIMDDSPSASETFTDQVGDTSTITTVNQTVTYNGSTYTQNATDSISGAGFSSIVFVFARGVGYTSFSYQGQTTTLRSFSVNQQNSYAITRSPSVVQASGSLTTQQFLKTVLSLF